MLKTLNSDWIKGMMAGAVVTIAAAATVTAVPEVVSQDSASSVQRELRHIHLDQADSSGSPIEKRYLKLSSVGAETGQISSLDVGDRITVGGKAGLKSVLEIVSVKTTSVHFPSAGQTAPSTIKIVMARDVEVPHRDPIRLIFDLGTQPGESVEKLTLQPRAL